MRTRGWRGHCGRVDLPLVSTPSSQPPSSTPKAITVNERLLVRLAALPRFVPVLGVLVCLALGGFVPKFGWVFTGLVVAFLGWMLAMSWPRLTGVERLMRVAVTFFVAAIALTQLRPRG